MSSRTRDIASILGKSEAANPDNIKLLKVGDAAGSSGGGGSGGGSDPALPGGSGTTTGTAATRIDPGDVVILNSLNKLERAGHQFQNPHQVLNDIGDHYMIDSSSSTAGPTSNGRGPLILYLENNKFVVISTSSSAQYNNTYTSLYIRAGQLDTDGYHVKKWGPQNSILSYYYNSGTSYGGAGAGAWDAWVGTDNKVHIATQRVYYSSYARYIGYVYTKYINDINDPDDLTMLTGTTQSIQSSTTSSNNLVFNKPMVFARPDRQAAGLLYYKQEGTPTGWRRVGYVTNGNTVNVGSTTDNSVTGTFDNYAYYHRPTCLDPHVSSSSNNNFSCMHKWTSQTNFAGANVSPSGAFNINLDQTAGFSSTDDGNITVGVTLYDSAASINNRKMGVCVYRDASSVLKVRSFEHASYGSDPTMGAATIIGERAQGWPTVGQDKRNGKMWCYWNDDTADKIKFRGFFTDSNRNITMDDSTHILRDSDRDPPPIQHFTQLPDHTGILAYIDFHTAGRGHTDRYAGGIDNTDNTIAQQSKARIRFIKPELRDTTNVTQAGYLGIAQDSGDSGDTITVKLNGEIDTNQFGLTPNVTYYINELDGSLESTTTNGSVRAGIATANGSIKITTTDSG